jgi:steroid delta-isomerase-like uncharacterized protein
MQEQNKGLLRRFYEEVFNKGNEAAVDELTDPSFVDHDAFNPTHDIEGVRQFTRQARAAFPDIRFIVEDLVAEGDKVVARFRMEGTHRGEFQGIPPSGKRISATGIDILRFSNGKAVEHWGEFDQLGMLQQLGAIPQQS